MALAVVVARAWLTDVDPRLELDGLPSAGTGRYVEHLVVEAVELPAPEHAVVTLLAVLLEGEEELTAVVRRLAVPIAFDGDGAQPGGTPWWLPEPSLEARPPSTTPVEDLEELLAATEALHAAGYTDVALEPAGAHGGTRGARDRDGAHPRRGDGRRHRVAPAAPRPLRGHRPRPHARRGGIGDRAPVAPARRPGRSISGRPGRTRHGSPASSCACGSRSAQDGARSRSSGRWSPRRPGGGSPPSSHARRAWALRPGSGRCARTRPDPTRARRASSWTRAGGPRRSPCGSNATAVPGGRSS
jgi:hypothetical protein